MNVELALVVRPARPRRLDGHRGAVCRPTSKAADDIAEAFGIAVRRASDLYRTEFLYLNMQRGAERSRTTIMPTPPPMHNRGRQAAGHPHAGSGGRQIHAGSNWLNPERNPFLGDRSIRMCLHDIPMFKRQLRAILRASALGRCPHHVPDDLHA